MSRLPKSIHPQDWKSLSALIEWMNNPPRNEALDKDLEAIELHVTLQGQTWRIGYDEAGDIAVLLDVPTEPEDGA